MLLGRTQLSWSHRDIFSSLCLQCFDTIPKAQALKDGFQDELPDVWLANGNPWEIARPEITYKVGFYGTVDDFKWSPAERVRYIHECMRIVSRDLPRLHVGMRSRS